MQKWEYRTFRADRDDYKGFFKGVKNEKFEKDINELGKEGWEFVGSGMNDGLNAMILVFKRPLQGCELAPRMAVPSVQRHRRWIPKQKLDIVKQNNEPGSSVSLIARQHGFAAELFQWRKAYLEGSLVAVSAN